MTTPTATTFDILERLALTHPALSGAFSRSTGGVDVDCVVRVLGEAQEANAALMVERASLIETKRMQIEALTASLVAARAPIPEQTGAVRDVLTERRRQVEAEGWSPSHDDSHTQGDLAIAAASYAISGANSFLHFTIHEIPADRLAAALWPWEMVWYKDSGSNRRKLVKAAALLLAEIERLDRRPPSTQHVEADGVGGDWVLVPREPTEAMVRTQANNPQGKALAAKIYRAMLAAAPKPSGDESGKGSE